MLNNKEKKSNPFDIPEERHPIVKHGVFIR